MGMIGKLKILMHETRIDDLEAQENIHNSKKILGRIGSKIIRFKFNGFYSREEELVWLRDAKIRKQTRINQIKMESI